jgi:hypothetical protein
MTARRPIIDLACLQQRRQDSPGFTPKTHPIVETDEQSTICFIPVYSLKKL